MIKKLSYNAFYIIFGVFSLWTTAAGIFAAEGNTIANIILAAGCALLVCAVAFIASKLPQINEKVYKAVVGVFFIAYFGCITFLGTTTMTVPISDLEVLVRAARHWLENGDIVAYSSYFTVCRNTLGNAIFIYLMFIPMHLLGIDIRTDTAECWGIAVNCLMIVLTVFFLYRLVARLVKNRNLHIVFLLLSGAYVPCYLWAHRYYSDTLSLPFLALGIWLYVKSREKDGFKKIVYALICGVVLWAGYFIRGGIVVVLVAVLIFSLFADGRNFVKSGLCVVLAFAVAMAGWNWYVNNNSWIDFSDTAKDEYPLTMWLMYGAHGEGNYNDDDVNYMQSLPDLETRKEAAKEKLKEYYSQYNFKTYLEFLHLKYGITYGNGLFDSELYLNNQRHGNFTHQFLIEGMPLFAPFRYIANGLHLATLLLTVAGAFVNWRRKQWNVPMLMQIVLLGNIIFFSFWETKARYAFGVTPVLLFLAFYSAVEIAAAVKEKLAK